MGDQVSHPYKTTGKITILYILMCACLDTKLEDKRYGRMLSATNPGYLQVDTVMSFRFHVRNYEVLTRAFAPWR